MCRRGVPDDVAESVVGRFVDIGLVDDAAFAQAWVESRHSGRGLGRRALATELRRKGVPDQHIEVALAELDGDSERSTAVRLATKKLRTLPAELPVDACVRRVAGLLARRGYSSALAFAATKEAIEARSGAVADFDATGAADPDEV